MSIAPTPPPRDAVVRSPCIAVCRMESADGLCAGCLRTLEEIAEWGGMPDDDKRRVLAAIDERRRARAAAAPSATRPTPVPGPVPGRAA
jgi:predicted Fe-S protein YdhL (DUF1289 family)